MWSNRRLTASSGEVKAVLLRVDSEQPCQSQGAAGIWARQRSPSVSSRALWMDGSVCFIIGERGEVCVQKKRTLSVYVCVGTSLRCSYACLSISLSVLLCLLRHGSAFCSWNVFSVWSERRPKRGTDAVKEKGRGHTNNSSWTWSFH